MKNKTAEEVYVEMLKPAETVTLKVQHRPDDFSMLKDVAGDGFYIRYIPTNASRRLSTCSSSVKGPVKLSPRRLISVHPALYIYIKPRAGNFLIQPIMFQICCVTAVMLITPQI